MRNQLTRWLFSLATVGIMLWFTSAAIKVSAAPRPERHPRIRAAIKALQAARGDLQNAAHDYCGHRAEALEATNRALLQLRLALGSDRTMLTMPETSDGLRVEKAAWVSVEPIESHPLIRKAISALEAARDDLEDAAHDFHGHRVEAREAVINAISQLTEALACERRERM